MLAAELAPRGITVNVMAPGGVETKMLRSLPKEMVDILAQRTPFGIGQSSDIAGMAAFLAGDEASWITNEKFRVDGGVR